MRRQREEDSYGNTLLFAEKYTKNYLVTEVVLLKSGLVSLSEVDSQKYEAIADYGRSTSSLADLND